MRFTSIARSRGSLKKNSIAASHLNRALELIDRANSEDRIAIRGIRSSPLGDLTLQEAFSQVPQEVAAPPETKYSVCVEGWPRALRPVLIDDLYRIGREAIANAFLHSGAKFIQVEIEYASNRLRLLVRDDGCGINAETLQSGRTGHWGLVGMRERAERIGGVVHVFSRRGAGTEVVLTICSALAFESEERPGWLLWFRRLLTSAAKSF